jgi:glucose/arabinose dehydrogenase
MAQCRKCQWPEWEGDLFSGALSGKKVMRVKVDGRRVVEQESLFQDLGARIRDVAFGPDGALYLLTDEPKGRLLRATAPSP